VYELVIRLQKRGHEITVFGTGDTQIPGVRIIPALRQSLAMYPPVENPFYLHTSGIAHMLMDVQEHARELDIIHSHLYPEFFPLTIADGLPVPMVTTVHAQMTSELVSILKRFPKANLVAISEAHKRLSEGLSMTVVKNGINLDDFPFNQNPTGDYLLFLGRFAGAKDANGTYLDPKGVLIALEVAQKTGRELLLSGNVEDRKFFDDFVKPKLNDNVRFIGDISPELPLPRSKVVELMQNAKVLLMPIQWEEPFGLVMAEANACGTPVIAFRRGAVPEIIQDGVNGFITDSIDQMIEKIDHVGSLDRQSCRKVVEEKFSFDRMVDDYERVYETLIK
jgi:glycosyltransferase involved in cell wall biosynthesis